MYSYSLLITIFVVLLQLCSAAPLVKRNCPYGTQPVVTTQCVQGSTNPYCAGLAPNDPRFVTPYVYCVAYTQSTDYPQTMPNFAQNPARLQRPSALGLPDLSSIVVPPLPALPAFPEFAD